MSGSIGIEVTETVLLPAVLVPYVLKRVKYLEVREIKELAEQLGISSGKAMEEIEAFIEANS